MSERPEFDDWIMEMLEVVRKRSTCVRRQHAAIIIRDKQIISTGYNGAPAGCAHCTEDTCIRIKMNVPSGEHYEICKSSHAENNAIVQCAKYGISTNGATLYITGYPCAICIKTIINAGIKKIIVGDGHPGDKTMTKQLIEESGIECEEYKYKKKDNDIDD